MSEPAQTKPKYEKVIDAHAQVPGFWVGWKAPASREPDYYALGIIERILSAGDSSRLYQRMVKGDQVALQASAGYDERRGPGAFEASILYKPDHTAEQVRNIFWDEIDKLKKAPVSKQELDTARNQILRQLFSSNSHQSLQRSLGRAEMLAEYTLFYGHPKYIDEDIEAYMKVTPDDVQRVANKYFTREGVTVLDVEPAGLKKTYAGGANE